MVKKLLVGVGILVLLLLGIGFALPQTITVTRSLDVNAPAERVYPFVATTAAWKAWSPWNRRDPGMAITYSGPAAGTGATWEWKSPSQGDGRMTFTAADSPSRLAYELEIVGMGPPSTGDFTFRPNASGGTTITWTMTSTMGMGPIGGWFGLYFPKMLGADFESGLAALKEAAESAPTPPAPANDSAAVP